MASKDFRQKKRRESERRLKNRRINPYPFGSTEWVNLIQQEYLLWPRQDRRSDERRAQPRRQGCRRIHNSGRVRSYGHRNSMQDLLTNEEKQMLNELSQSDIPD
jgi:hypothetical protein